MTIEELEHLAETESMIREELEVYPGRDVKAEDAEDLLAIIDRERNRALAAERDRDLWRSQTESAWRQGRTNAEVMVEIPR